VSANKNFNSKLLLENIRKAQLINYISKILDDKIEFHFNVIVK